MSRDAETLKSGRKPTSKRFSKKLWSSIPYTRSRKSTIGDLCSGQKLAFMSGSVTLPSGDAKKNTLARGKKKQSKHILSNRCSIVKLLGFEDNATHRTGKIVGQDLIAKKMPFQNEH